MKILYCIFLYCSTEKHLTLEVYTEKDLTLEVYTEKDLTLEVDTEKGLTLEVGTEKGLTLEVGTEKDLTLKMVIEWTDRGKDQTKPQEKPIPNEDIFQYQNFQLPSISTTKANISLWAKV